MADPTKILIADDHAMFRAGIRALLESEPFMEVIGEDHPDHAKMTDLLEEIRAERADR